MEVTIDFYYARVSMLVLATASLLPGGRLSAGHRTSAAAGPSSRRFAVPSAATSCRPERSGTAVLAYPNCLSHPCAWL
ncbi:hypothetical protein, partial [Candidatus Pantoea formicae]|uniref:hypothetical protein n=1 Tax=Candidatus Pantoea formicae TaxID=2608355 RepID=UPI001964A8C8